MSLHADLYKNLITLSCLLGEAKKNADFGSVAFYSYGFNEIAKHLTGVFATSGVEQLKSEFANVLLTLALQGILAEDLYKDLVVKLGHKPTGLLISDLLPPQVAAESHQIISQPQQRLLPSAPVVQQQPASLLRGPIKNVNAAPVVKAPLIAPPPKSGVIDKVEALKIPDFPSTMDFSDLKTASVLPILHVVTGSDDLDTVPAAKISSEVEVPVTISISQFPPVDDDIETIPLKPIKPVNAFDDVSSGFDMDAWEFVFDDDDK